MDHIPLPRESAVHQLIKDINGPNRDPSQFGYMNTDRANQVLDLFKAALETPTDGAGNAVLRKDVTQSTGAVNYDLMRPALNLFPTVTPLRNAIARVGRDKGGTAVHWKSILATTGSGQPYMGWVPEGQRSASMSYNVTDVSATYATFGEEDSLTDEALWASEGFEDEAAMVQLRMLLKTFVKEEAGILGGNRSLSLGTPSTPTASTGAAAGATINITCSVIVVALTQEGYQNSSLTGGVATALTITGNDGKSYTLNGGSSQKSSAASQAVSTGNYLAATVPVVNGAVAYAWYIGTSGNEKLEAITTINSVKLTALAGTGQAASAITADCSKNASYAFDGLMTTAYNAGSNAYVKSLATGTAGAGTGLTASGAGGITEIDTMLRAMWDNYRISPTVIYVNSQELQNITSKVLTNGSTSLLRYNLDADQQGMVEYKLTAAGVVSFYFNPFTPDGGVKIPIKVHPNLAPGTLIAWAERLPPWYVSNNTPNVAEMLVRRDYYTEVWPKTSRTQYYGTYCSEVLAIYAPFSCGIITNIANA